MKALYIVGGYVMNKKLISMALTGVLAVGVLSVATPSVADARKTKPETSTDIYYNLLLCNHSSNH